MTPHVAFVAPNIWPILSADRTGNFAGGAEVRQTMLARALAASGRKVSVIALDFDQPEGVVVDGIAVHRAHKLRAGLPGLRFFHPRLTSWWRAMGRTEADVFIQSTASYLTGVVAAFCRFRGRGFIYSGASDPDFQRDQVWKKFDRRGGWRDLQMYQWGLKRADAIVAQHAGQVASCRQWYGREAVEIPSCYVPPPGAGASPRGVVLWVAMMRSLKRPELFLEMARRLPHLRFRIIGGPGPEKERGVYENMKAAAQEVPNLEFMGFVPFAEVENHFSDARVFVNTSDYEGFPNTFLQSWARGVPTVSFFDCQGRDDDGRPVGSICRDLEDMTQTVARLCADDALWYQESERVRRYFQSRHTVDVAVEHYSRLIDKLLQNRSAR